MILILNPPLREEGHVVAEGVFEGRTGSRVVGRRISQERKAVLSLDATCPYS
ncbi:hypothetical protein [Mesotoga sp.]|uniref:hypothetical protein n=1 Tax=Mesotoga sp. TaxID=2053577 RepID=UPI0035648B2D